MRIKKSGIAIFLTVLLFGCGCGDPQNSSDPEEYKLVLLSEHNGEEVDIVHPRLREYLELEDEDEICGFLSKYSETDFSKPRYTLSWETAYAQEYTVKIGTDKDLTDPYEVKTSETSLSVGWLCPGETYYWEVSASADEKSAVGSFKVKDEPIRTLDIDGVGNARDAGGWTTESGKKVKYGLIYRGGKLNGTISAAGKSTMTDMIKKPYDESPKMLCEKFETQDVVTASTDPYYGSETDKFSALDENAGDF